MNTEAKIKQILVNLNAENADAYERVLKQKDTWEEASRDVDGNTDRALQAILELRPAEASA